MSARPGRLRAMTIHSHKSSYAWIEFACIQPQAIIARELSKYHLYSRACVIQTMSVPYPFLACLHDWHTLACEPVRMCFDLFESIVSRHNAGGMMCVVVGVRNDRESGISSAEVDLSSIQRTHIVGVSPYSGSGAGSGA